MRVGSAVVMASLILGVISTNAAQAATSSTESTLTSLQLQLASLQKQLAFINGNTLSNSVITSASVEVGDRIQATANVNVRLKPSIAGSKIATLPALSMGTVLTGPVKTVEGQTVPQTTTGSDSWFEVKYDTGVTGWTAALWIRDVGSDYGGVPAGTEAVTCNSFTFTPSSVAYGEQTTATWSTSNASKVILMNARGEYVKEFRDGQSYTFTPEQTGLYTIKAIGNNNTQATCAATVIVRNAKVSTTTAAKLPSCEYIKFSPANVKKGATTDLSWKVANAAKVILTNTLNSTQEEHALEGSISLTAEKGVTYFLTSVRSDGVKKVLCSSTLVVQDTPTTATAPICNQFSYSPMPAKYNTSVTTTWDTTNARRVILSSSIGGLNKELSADGTYSFIAKVSSLYTLTAIGTDGTRAACTTYLNVEK